MVRKRLQHSADSVTTEIQPFYGINISTTTVSQELRGKQFYVWAAECKHYITKHNPKRQMSAEKHGLVNSRRELPASCAELGGSGAGLVYLS